MPRTLTTEIEAFAHCRDPRCAGYLQEKVKGVREVVEITYVDSGGDMPGVEKSMVYIRFQDETDIDCPTCGQAREVTEQKRRVYQPLSGHAQDGLLQYKPREFPVEAT